MLKWFSSFLTTRQQGVVINGCAFDWSPVLSGVPQGSILGPLLFIFDLPSVVSSPMKIFADDVAIYCPVTSTADCKAFQTDLDLISSWCSIWQMRLNPSKCEFLCIPNKCSPIHHSYYLDNHLLQSVLSVKYLGVIVNYYVVTCTFVMLQPRTRLSGHLYCQFWTMLVSVESPHTLLLQKKKSWSSLGVW